MGGGVFQKLLCAPESTYNSQRKLWYKLFKIICPVCYINFSSSCTNKKKQNKRGTQQEKKSLSSVLAHHGDGVKNSTHDATLLGEVVIPWTVPTKISHTHDPMLQQKEISPQAGQQKR